MRYLYPTVEYLRPYKLITFFFGLMFLLIGAAISGLPDWDMWVSLLMALPAYLTAAPTLRVLIERRWGLLLHAAFWTWFTVDGIYIIYWGLRNPIVLDALRWANLPASLALYLACGLIWYHRYPVVYSDDDFDWLDEDQYH